MHVFQYFACMQVYGENTLIFPLLVAETFARVYQEPPSFKEQSELKQEDVK